MNQVINAMRKRVCDANQSLQKHGLVKFTWAMSIGSQSRTRCHCYQTIRRGLLTN